MLTALLLALSCTQPRQAPADRAFVFEPGEEPRVEYTADFMGRLHAWPSDRAARVLVEDAASGEPRGDVDDRGAHVVAEVFPGTALLVRCELEGERSTPLRLELRVAPESAAALELGRAVHAFLTTELPQRLERGELSQARARTNELISAVLAVDGVELSPAAGWAASELGKAAWRLGDVAAMGAAFELVLRRQEALLHPSSDELQETRLAAAYAARALGHGARALELEEAAEQAALETRPEEDDLVVRARRARSATLERLGRAREAMELKARLVEVLERSRPEDDLFLQTCRVNLATSLLNAKDFARALALLEPAVEIMAAELAPDEPSLLIARQNLAVARTSIGDVEGGAAELERVHRAMERARAPDDTELLRVRENLSQALELRGDLSAARALQESVLLGLEARLPRGDPSVALARMNLSGLLLSCGDYERSRALGEQALAELERALGPDDRRTIDAGIDLALTFKALGEPRRALALEERVLANALVELPEEHQLVQRARMNLATTLAMLGEAERARTLYEAALASLEARDDPLPITLAFARTLYGDFLLDHGEPERAAAQLEEAVALRERLLPADHPNLVGSRVSLLATYRALERRAECVDQARLLCDALARRAERLVVGQSPREADARVLRLNNALSPLLGLDEETLAFAPDLRATLFELVETLRGAGLAAAAVARLARRDADVRALRWRARAASEALVRATRGEVDAEALLAAREARDRAQRELSERLADDAASRGALAPPTLAGLAAALPEDGALVAYWTRVGIGEADRHGARPLDEQELLAFVVRPDGALARVRIGEAQRVEEAVDAWRGAVLSGGVGLAPGQPPRGVALGGARGGDERAAGEALRALVLDPVRPLLGDARRVVIALDGGLHRVPLDALPLDDGRVGDALAVQVRSTSRELLLPPGPADAQGTLVVLGDASFARMPLDLEERARVQEQEATPDVEGASAPPPLLRGTPWEHGFAPLPATGPEARAIAALCERSLEDTAPILLEGRHASRVALERLAPRARWLHVATHGWSSASSPAADVDAESDAAFRTPDELVRGASPMVLCGIALAGADLPADSLGRVPGLVTAEEVAGWDLAGCELAVLSACETSVGVRRAGEGVASLQKALHMAGARSVVTSLWAVPDEATRELMERFYTALWVERVGKAEALWRAKCALREQGRPPRDWAAWVLSGDPD